MVKFIEEGKDNPLQYSGLGNPMDRGAWWVTVHGVARSRTWLSNFTFTFHFHVLEKEMAAHSSVLAWRIPGTGEPGGLQSMGSHRARHERLKWLSRNSSSSRHLFIPSVIQRWFSSMLFSHHNFVFLRVFFLWFISSLIVLSSEKMLEMISIFLNLPRLNLCLYKYKSSSIKEPEIK